MSRQDKLNGFLSGIIIGGLAGSILSLLYTPMTGRKMRRKIAKTGSGIMDDLNTYIETGKDTAEEIIKEGKKRANIIMDDAKKLVSN